MSAIKISDTVFTISSVLSVEDIAKAKKGRPESTTLFKGEGKEREPVFCVGIGAIESFNQNGITFVTNGTVSGKAVVTCPLPSDLKKDEIKNYVADKVGFIKKNLDAVEAQVVAALAEIDADRAEVLASIEGLDDDTDAE